MHVLRAAIRAANAVWGSQWYSPWCGDIPPWRWDFDTSSWIMTRSNGECMRIPGDHPDLADADPASELYVGPYGYQRTYRINPEPPGCRVFVWVSGSFVEVV